MDMLDIYQAKLKHMESEHNKCIILLKESLHVLNVFPNRKISGRQYTTYEFAKMIEELLKSKQ